MASRFHSGILGFAPLTVFVRPTASHIMKKIILTLICFSLVLACLTFTAAEITLAAAKDSAKDYHLVQTQMLDSDPAGGTPLTVYVLLFPDDTRPEVFKTFDSKEMEAWLGALPRGSVVHYDANGFLPRVLPAKLEALKASCQKKGVSFIESPVN